MLDELLSAGKRPSALLADERAAGGVRPPMLVQRGRVAEPPRTEAAHVRPLARVCPHVVLQVLFIGKCLPAQLAAVGLLPRV